ncbi:MAG: hypothetical protein KIS66_12305 [Fimbriimonadaceae bacterium]|nr:hypothetical protein [Fimbriimonadaceae bacterium]
MGVVPGAAPLVPLLRKFAKGGSGIVTSFSDSLVRVCHELCEDEELDVVPFASLVGTCLTLLGESPRPLVPTGIALEAVASACRNLAPNSLFQPTARLPGLHRVIARALDELACWGVDAGELERLADLAEGSLERRLRSLAEVATATDALLEGLGLVRNAWRIARLEETVLSDGVAFPRVLLVVGPDAEPHRLRWLRWAAGVPLDLTVVVESHPVNRTLFEAGLLVSEALGIEVEPAGPSDGFARRLFANRPGSVSSPSAPQNTETPYEPSGRRLRIANACDPLAEAEWTLRDALERHEEGVPFDRMFIVARDLDTYGPLLRVAADRLGIPLRLDLRRPLLENAFCRLTLSVLEFCAEAKTNRLVPVVRSSYLNLSRVVQAEVLDRIRQFQGPVFAWDACAAYAASRPDLGWLSLTIAWRMERSAQVHPLYEWQRAFVDWVGDMPWSESCLFGSGRTEERDKRCMTAMQRALAHAASVGRVRKERPAGFLRFVQACRQAWSEADTSVPFGSDGIRVVRDATDVGLGKIGYVLGVLEGVFPRRRREDAILSDADREQMDRLRPGCVPLPKSERQARQEREAFYRACVTASDRLQLSYPQTSDDRDNVPAFYLDEVGAADPGVERIVYSRTALVPAAPLATADRLLAQALAITKSEVVPTGLASPEVALRVAWPAAEPVSVSALRDARQCPFRWLVRHRLGLRPTGTRERWMALASLPDRAGLLESPDRERAQRDLEVALSEALLDLAGSADPWELRLLEVGGRRLIEQWVDREIGARALWPRTTLRGHARFGDQGLRAEIPDKATPFILYGTISGLSDDRGNPRVHLFEARSIESSEGRITDPGDELYVGLFLLASNAPGRRSTVEIDTFDGGRRLFVFGDAESYHSRPAEGLMVTRLEPHANLLPRVKQSALATVGAIRTAAVTPTPSDRCTGCAYGELCRSSQLFGEQRSTFYEEADGP